MTTTVTRLFENYADARKAVSELESSGIAHDRVSLVANNEGERYSEANRYGMEDVADDAETGAGTGATMGTILGGGAGLLAGIGMLAIPGVGPIVAAGWLIATATGAGVGAAAGGLLGSLVGAGVSEDDAHIYTEGVRRGGTLVSVRTEEADVSRVEQTLSKYSPVDIAARGTEYRSGGWSRFDESAPAYSASTPDTMGTAGTLADPAGTLGSVSSARGRTPV